jgi:glycogen debranching enzyme
MINMRWDESAGLFWATKDNQKIDVRTPFNLFALITGRMPEGIANRLVETLTDPKQFWGQYGVPTVAFDDPTHEPETMWRGPIWLNVNYLLLDGLLRAGFHDVAHELRRRSIEMVLNNRDIVEYYDPRTGTGPPRAVSSFGWTSALFIDMVIQETSTHQ